MKLFSAIAGVALVLAAVFFLKYSLDSGWLQPPVRVAIGIAVALALLVACELKVARRYAVTANALDAAAIAILFATFFSAHALWNLIPAVVTFVLLGIVTALAVVLSIRRESLFIAVLGLLGGFATPALLSTGENQPIPLFAYLVLLNIGLAWVAYQKKWPLLTGLTLVLTTVYQWSWVLTFLSASQLTLAMGIFLVFPFLSVAGLVLARRQTSPGDDAFERTAMLGAGVPLLFVVYLSAVPGYGARPWLLFGFLLLVDAGLLAIAAMRGQKLLHAAGAASTVAVLGIWLATSYAPAHLTVALTFIAVFVAFYTLASLWLDRREPLNARADNAVYAAPLLLAGLTALATMDPALAVPTPLFATLLPLTLLIAWRAVASNRGGVHFTAVFFATATQAAWIAVHFEPDRLSAAVPFFAAFALAWMFAPAIARRAGRLLHPDGAGIVLIASTVLLASLAEGTVSGQGIWGFALLLAVLTAALFVGLAGGSLSLVNLVASIFSMAVLGRWWLEFGGIVGVLPALTVMTGLCLVAFSAYAWTHRLTPLGADTPPNPPAFWQGLYIALLGHVFLLCLVANREWSLPPWQWLGALGVLTLGASALALRIRSLSLHTAAAVAGAVVVAVWTAATGSPWGVVALVSAAAIGVYSLAWIPLAARAGAERTAAAGAVAVLFAAEATAILASAVNAPPPFGGTLTSHVVQLSVLLAIAWRYQWTQLAAWAVAPAAVAVTVQWQNMDVAVGTGWGQLLALSLGVYAVFTAYPFILGRRSLDGRGPYVAAVLAAGLLLLGGHAALKAGGYGWMVGALPVAQAAIMAVLLRQLVRLQLPADRDLGRLALVGAAALALITVAIPLQLQHQWITIGWALQGAAVAWLYRRIPHRGLLFWSVGLLAAVFVRLAMNPEVLLYEPRGSMRIVNWYLYAYLICAAAFLAAARLLATTRDSLPALGLRASQLLPGGAVILLFLLLNIEIADFFATGPTVVFRFGGGLSQDLTYTIGWLLFGLALLAVYIYQNSRAGRITALALVAVTTFKCFLYDLGSLEGLYRVGSFVGLAMSLALVSLALQRFVLVRPEEPAL